MSALDDAVDAVRHLHHVHDTGTIDDAAEQSAIDLVAHALSECRHDDIAEIAGVSGLDVIRLIRDDELRARALRRERFLAEHYLAEVRDELRTETVRWATAGVEKKFTCETFGVSRPTLDTWLADKR